jgi:two-component system LytT family response regulator
MIKALIIDDEQKARNILHHYLTSFVPQITEVRLADSASNAESILEVYKPDIVFLDVEMPHRNGFDFLTAQKNFSFDVIFTTAYNQYAIQAIRFSALDYLLKPVDPEELQAAVARHLERKLETGEQEMLYTNLSENLQRNQVKDFTIAVPSAEGTHFFKIEDIVRLEADRAYTYIHLSEKKPFIASKSLKHFEEMLDEFRFIRTHKSHLINPRHISRISGDHEHVLLTDGSKVEVSRRKKDEVLQQLNLK